MAAKAIEGNVRLPVERQLAHAGANVGRSVNGNGRIGTAVLGGGPAGLTAAYTLAARGRHGVVFEADDIVGGIARTIEVDGFRFDLGGHRFFTKLKAIEELWERMLGDELLTRPRLSRIYFGGKYFSYPLRARDVPSRLGVIEATRCVLSYLAAATSRQHPPETFEEWVTLRFGKRLYDAFFRSYTEKVWGIPGSEIRSEWAAQRIKNFSLGRALLSLAGIGREPVTTLIEEFRYPRLGPGQMWEAFREHVEESGIPILLEHRCVGMRHRDGTVESVLVESGGVVTEHAVDSVVTSIPLAELVRRLDPVPPAPVLDAAGRLRYRDLCLVAIMTRQPVPFADNWIYLHDPGIRAGRVQNFGAWSADMVPPGSSCLGAEYFCFEDDEIWTMPEEEAIRFATDELARIGLLDPSQVLGGARVKVPKAYPMYDLDYAEAVAVIRDYLEGFSNLQTCGRNGLHRYNNQDHSMWTAILATLNILDGASHDVWSVNTEAEYHEEGEAVDAVLLPEAVAREVWPAPEPRPAPLPAT